MADTTPRRSAFADVAPDGRFDRPGIVALRDLGSQWKTILKGRATPAFRDAVAACLGAPPPEEPMATARGTACDLLWLAPGEWLVVAEGEVAPSLAAAGLVAVEVGDGLPGLELSGPRARDLLAGGTALDLHPRAFAAGRATRTRLGRIGVLLHRVADHSDAGHPGGGPVYRLHVERPWAGHLWSWLADAALDHPPGGDTTES